MKRAPQDLIQNKTAVFWLQYPFCSTSACQLAPLGMGRESRDFFGGQGENTGYRRVKSEYPILEDGTGRVLWEVCTARPADPTPLHTGAAQESSAGEGNSHPSKIPSELLACPPAVWQQKGKVLKSHPCSPK